MDDIIISTTNQLPSHIELVEICDVVQDVQIFRMDRKNLIETISEKFTGNNDGSFQKMVSNFRSIARSENCNLIFGLSVSSSIQEYKNGTFLYLTYLATIGKYKLK